MPQIFIMCESLEIQQLKELGRLLIPVVENEFGIEEHNDTAYTGINEISTINEADLQIEIRYTAGRDEYQWGKPFDPTLDEQKRLAEAIKLVVDEFLRKTCHRVGPSLSIWCKPFYNSHFQMWGYK